MGPSRFGAKSESLDITKDTDHIAANKGTLVARLFEPGPQQRNP